jgi:hypothetical protein
MKYIKIALLAGGLASVSTLALAQAGAPTAGVDFRSVYGSNTSADGNASYTRAGKHVRARAASHASIKQRATTGSGITDGSGVGSPD